jgi:hypothetical protein
MTTLVDFRAWVLYALGISGTSPERGFDDASIDRHIQQAVAEFSLHVPAEARADIGLGGGSRQFALAALTRPLRVRAVEYPPDRWPRAFVEFAVWAGTVTLELSPPETAYTVRVYYTQQHLVDAAGSTVPAAHEHVVVEGAAALAILARAMGAANTAETATVAPQTYQHLRVAQERLLRWREMLRRLGGQLECRTLRPVGHET